MILIRGSGRSPRINAGNDYPEFCIRAIENKLIQRTPQVALSLL
jgi:hypothetical protein